MNVIMSVLLCTSIVACILCMRGLKKAEHELNKLKDDLEEAEHELNKLKDDLE